jgi:hypothetical protein
MKLEWVREVYSLMPSVPTIHEQIWVDPMHRAVQKKVPRLRYGYSLDPLTIRVRMKLSELLAYFGKITRLFLGKPNTFSLGNSSTFTLGNSSTFTLGNSQPIGYPLRYVNHSRTLTSPYGVGKSRDN